MIQQKKFYLGTLFLSTMILAPLSTQAVLADTTSAPQTSTNPTIKNTTSTTITPNNSQPTNPVPSTDTTIKTASPSSPPTNTPPVTSQNSVTTTSNVQPKIATTTISSPTTTTTTNLPNNLTDSTAINFTDPLLNNMIKQQFNLKPTDTLTVAKVKSFYGQTFNATETSYLVGQTQTSMSDQQSTPIESLNGMQYLQLLPSKTKVAFQVKLASDPKADEDLTPLIGLNLGSIDLIGNYNNPNAQEIDVKQIPKLNIQNANDVEFNGDLDVSYNSGINNQQLKEIAPWLVQYSHNGNSLDQIQLSNSAITDFTPLKGTETSTRTIIIAENNANYDPEPIYAVNDQPISFKAKPVLGLDGDDLASGYHFSNTVPQENLAEDNLTNLGNNNYVLKTPLQNAQVLSYGYLGFGYGLSSDDFVNKNYGNANLQYFILNGQPLIWQAHPNVTVNYLDQTGKVLSPAKLFNGDKIDDPYDLTANSTLPGYQLTNESNLKGKFTQNPQIINLVYQALTKPITKPSSNSVTPSIKIPVYDNNGQLTNVQINPHNLIIIASQKIKGQTFYQLSSGHWVLSDDFYTGKPTAHEIRSFDPNAKLVDAAGQKLSIHLAPNSQWQYSKIVMIDQQPYYEITNNEFLAVNDGVVFTPSNSPMILHINNSTTVYNSKGQPLNTSSTITGNWQTDGFAFINGVKMYRIANDEWISAKDAYVFQRINKTFYSKTTTPLYDKSGNLIPNQTLPAHRTWKIDQQITIGNQNYYRVATNEFIKA